MSVLIRVHGIGDGREFNLPLWVEGYDVDLPPENSSQSYFLDDGTAIINGAFGGKVILTPDRNKALRFASSGAAMMAWGTRSAANPTRPDGKPNKPMTALTVEIEPE